MNGRPVKQEVAPARIGSWDPVLVAGVAALIYVVHGFQGAMNRDLGIFVYGAQRVADGNPPYVANFNTVGPLADAVPGLAVWVGGHLGVGAVMSSRLLYWVLSSLACALVYSYGRAVLSSRVGGFLSASLFLTFETFTNLATNGPRDKTAMVFFLVAGLLLVSRRRWLAAGIATGLATLTWQPALLPLLAATVAAVIGSRAWWRDLLRYVAGGIVAAVAMLVWFAAESATGVAIKAFLLVNLRWVHQPSAFASLGGTWRLLWDGYHLSLIVALGGVIGALAVALLRRRDRELWPCAVGGAVALLWTATAVNGAPDLLVVLPFGAVGSAVVLGAAARRAGRRRLAAAAGLCLLCLGYAAAFSVTTRAHGLVVQARDVRAVLHVLPPESTVATVDAPQPLVISGRVNPGPYLILDSGEFGLLRAEFPGGAVGYLQQLLAAHPALVAVGPGPEQDLIRQVVEADYVHVGAGPGWEWYASKRAPAALVSRLARVNEHALRAARRAVAHAG